jgi:hypothetical protein
MWKTCDSIDLDLFTPGYVYLYVTYLMQLKPQFHMI